MNITDLIVELLEKGQKVELPGIGTLDTVMRNAYHDPATRTYYPASRTIAFSTEVTGDNEMVRILAERECVNEDVARQMWLNYIDALSDKVKRSGRHNFGRLGTLTCADKSTFGFKVADGLMLDTDNKGEMPIEEVKIYSHEGEEDPFARFDEAEAAQAPAEEIPAEEAAPVEEPVAAEPAPAEEPAAQESHWDESLKKLEDMEREKPAIDPKAEARAEKERLKAEKKAEEERIKLEKKAAEQKRYEEELLAKQRKEAEKREAEEKRKAAEELRKAEKRAEEERIKAEKKAEAGRIKAEKEAEKERIKAEKKAAALAAIEARENAKAEAAARSASEKEAAKQAALQAAEAEKQRRAAEKEEREAAKAAEKEQKEAAKNAEKERKAAEKERKATEKAAAKQAKKEKKDTAVEQKSEDNDDGKKRSILPIIIILLVLLLLGAGAYYLLSHKKASTGDQQPTTTTTHIDAGKTNSLTYNTDMITCTEREIAQQSDMVCCFMSDYISEYLGERGFNGARAPMMDRIRQYANERLGQMLGDRFAVQRLIPYNDYIYNYNEAFMKKGYASRCRCKVQSELMSYRSLDDMLYRMVDELGLQPDGTGRKTAAEVQQVKADEKKAIERKRQQADNGETPMYVYVEKGSKLGFDLIAGFYLNKSTAAKMTAKLHEMGCDAYIIEFNDMYYVSMGSASSQTAAEALYKHVKSWYDGDVVIKKW